MTSFSDWPNVQQHFPQKDGDWVIIGYEPNSTNKLKYVAHGSGGAASLRNQFIPNTYQYGMIRFDIDKTSMNHTDQKAQRDIFFYYSGPDAPILKRGKYLENLGTIEDKFKPHHAKVEIKNKDAVTNPLIIQRTNPGSGSHVID